MSSEEHGEKKHGGGGHGHGGGGGGHEEAHEGAPEWLISFADNVTLMMGFFVILLAMNLKPAQTGGGGDSKEPGHPPATPEVLDMAIAIREAFNNPVDPANASPLDLPLVRRLIERSGASQSEQDGQIGRDHDVRSIRPSLWVSPAGSIPFDPASTILSDTGLEGLRQMQKIVRGHNLVIEIRGHASSAEAFDRPDRGMGLSYERALAVAQGLVAEGLPWAQLRIIACADGERLVPLAYDEAAHRTNQRVELIVTDRVVKQSLDESETGEPTPPP